MAAAVSRLRRIRIAAAAGAPLPADDGRWLAAAIGRYLDEAPAGLTVDDALGLTVLQGGEPWHAAEARDRRDAELRALVAFFPGRDIAGQVGAIRSAIRTYATTRWRNSDQHRGGVMPPAYAGTHRAHLFNAFIAGSGKVPSGATALRTILSHCEYRETRFAEIGGFERNGSGR